jgi:hypothetical protein
MWKSAFMGGFTIEICKNKLYFVSAKKPHSMYQPLIHPSISASNNREEL